MEEAETPLLAGHYLVCKKMHESDFVEWIDLVEWVDIEDLKALLSTGHHSVCVGGLSYDHHSEGKDIEDV